MRGNGLSAHSYAAVADLDPGTADVLLAALRDRGVAAYAAASPTPQPEGDMDRLYVDVAALEQARALVSVELSVAADEPGDPFAPDDLGVDAGPPQGADASSANPTVGRPDGVDISGIRISGMDLGGMDLGGMDLGGMDLAGMDLGSADLGSTDLGSTDLGSTDLGSTEIGAGDFDLGGLDVNAEFASIVAAFHSAPAVRGSWPASEDLDPPSPPLAGAPTAADPPPGPGAGAGPIGWEDLLRPLPDPEPAAEQGYIPPAPPPLPHASIGTRFAWAAVLGGPAVLFTAVLLGWQLADWVMLAAALAFLGGFVALVARLGDRPDDEDDDGAVV